VVAHPSAGGAAFTLIEILIVISIIGILITLAQPSFHRAVTAAREATLKENLFVLRDVIDQFYADNGKYPRRSPIWWKRGTSAGCPRTRSRARRKHGSSSRQRTSRDSRPGSTTSRAAPRRLRTTDKVQRLVTRHVAPSTRNVQRFSRGAPESHAPLGPLVSPLEARRSRLAARGSPRGIVFPVLLGSILIIGIAIVNRYIILTEAGEETDGRKHAKHASCEVSQLTPGKSSHMAS